MTGVAIGDRRRPDRMRYVFDTSALLALRGDEPGAAELEDLLSKSVEARHPVLISFMTRMELLYIIRREEGEEAACQALSLLDAFSVEWVSCEPEILDAAAALNAEGGLSAADAWIGAAAIVREAVLIHCDPEFVAFKKISQQFIGKSPVRPPRPKNKRKH
jgi:predicted nucleic acid-binding protein